MPANIARRRAKKQNEKTRASMRPRLVDHPDHQHKNNCCRYKYFHAFDNERSGAMKSMRIIKIVEHHLMTIYALDIFVRKIARLHLGILLQSGLIVALANTIAFLMPVSAARKSLVF
jgi:hypothetical protein